MNLGKRLGLLLFFIFSLPGVAVPGSRGDASADMRAFPPLHTDAGVFLKAIRQAQGVPMVKGVTGLAVPHHLLAADLIAKALAMAAGQRYRRIIVISPDHFSRSSTCAAVTRRDFETILGPLTVDRAAVDILLTNSLITESALFSHEHGVRAVLPFIAHYFAETEVVPVVLGKGCRHADWDSLAQTLASIITSDTLLIQSTDYSHYLAVDQAGQRDMETMDILMNGDPLGVFTLIEPDHLDSRACQYLQLLLQKTVFGASPAIIAHRNSSDYTLDDVAGTTSYIVQLYRPRFSAPDIR
jgi:AmmeMemoRadiSam system protein B